MKFQGKGCSEAEGVVFWASSLESEGLPSRRLRSILSHIIARETLTLQPRPRHPCERLMITAWRQWVASARHGPKRRTNHSALLVSHFATQLPSEPPGTSAWKAILPLKFCQRTFFCTEPSCSRRLWAEAQERRRRPSEILFAPPTATRNGLAPPRPIGAPLTSENGSGNKLAKNLNWPKIIHRLGQRPQ